MKINYLKNLMPPIDGM